MKAGRHSIIRRRRRKRGLLAGERPGSLRSPCLPRRRGSNPTLPVDFSGTARVGAACGLSARMLGLTNSAKPTQTMLRADEKAINVTGS